MNHFDLERFGKALVRACQYETMYYKLLADHEELRDKYTKLLNESCSQSQEMFGNLLTLGIKLAEEKDSSWSKNPKWSE